MLGLGDIGALAGKPVMEGKGVLFKRFADIDVFDLEVNSHDPDEIIKLCQLLEPTFGGINLEDIKAPECFYIEETLKKTMKIPVFHDDQHGTAIISGAALLNALGGCRKDDRRSQSGVQRRGRVGNRLRRTLRAAGSEARRTSRYATPRAWCTRAARQGMNPYKERFAEETDLRTLSDAMQGADVFVGCSVKGAVTPEMIRIDGGAADRVCDGES